MTRRLVPAVLALALGLSLGQAPRVAAQTTEADVYVAQAIIDIDERRYVEALANLTKALEVEPDHIEALYYTGVVHAARRQPARAVPFLEKARAKSPRDPAIAFQLGLAYFAQEQYERAQPLFEAVFRTSPDLDGLGYYVGFLRYRKKEYREALDALRAGRSSDPEVQQLTRFYTGLALGVLGLPAQAAAEVEEALRLAPGSALTGPAERLRDTIVAAARQAGRRFSLDVRVGVTHDDNVDVRPTSNNREPQVAELRTHRHESLGELFGVRADYIWWKAENWEATAGYSFFTTYVNEIPKFNVISHLGTLGVNRRASLGPYPALLGATYAFDFLALDGDEFLTRNTLTLSAAIVESERHLTQVFFRYQDKDFAETSPPPVRQELRDANNWMFGFVHLVRFAQDRHLLKAGYQLDYDDTDGANYTYVGHRLTAGAQYTLPWRAVRLKYDLDVHLRAYSTANSILPTYAPGTKKRQDEEIAHVLRAELPLPRSVTLTAEYQTTRTHSNIEVFDFSRNVFSLVLSWSY